MSITPRSLIRCDESGAFLNMFLKAPLRVRSGAFAIRFARKVLTNLSRIFLASLKVRPVQCQAEKGDTAMKYQATFERYELKYLLTRAQKEFVLRVLEPYMELDHYGRTSIRNLYYDTDTFRLVRRSLERPAYKEKLRVRSYRAAGPEDSVFVELKKKYRSVVYKRRLAVPQQQALLACARERRFRTRHRSPGRSSISATTTGRSARSCFSPMSRRRSERKTAGTSV